MAAKKVATTGPTIIEIAGSTPEEARRFHAAAVDAAANAACRSVLVDLSALHVVDGGILGTLCALSGALGSRRLAVVASASVRDAMAEWRFDTVLDLFADRDAALATP